MTDTDKRTAAPTDKLTRVPVRHVYFADSMTFPAIDSRYSTLSNLKCYPEPANNKTFVLCDWIPAWQTFEFTFYAAGDQNVPKIRFTPAAMVASWEREDGPR